MRRTPIRDTELYYEDHGEGPAVVFVHGGGGNHLSWWQQVPAFAARYRCITFDQRGYGASLAGSATGADVLWRDLLALLDHLGIERAALVAQSLGGWATWGVTATHPERVWALVMGGTVGSIPLVEFDQWMSAMDQRIQSKQDPLGDAIPKRLREERPDLAFLYREIQGLNDPAAAAGLLQALGERVSTDWSAYAVPSLFIVGEEDVLMPPPLVEAASRVVPGARLMRVEGAGHSVYFERADTFNAAVADFLAVHAPR